MLKKVDFKNGANFKIYFFELVTLLDTISSSEARSELIICRMTECSASVAGGKEILLFCEKVTKDDIEVRFYQEVEGGRVVWEGFGISAFGCAQAIWHLLPHPSLRQFRN